MRFTIHKLITFLLAFTLATALPVEVEPITIVDENDPINKQNPEWASLEHKCLRIKGSYDFAASLFHADLYDGPLHVCGIHQFWDWSASYATDLRISWDCMKGYRASITGDLYKLEYFMPGRPMELLIQYWHDTWDVQTGERSVREMTVSQQRTAECRSAIGIIDPTKYGNNEGRVRHFDFHP